MLIQINVSEFINKLVSFLFCEFNRVTSWNECKYIILERSSSQIGFIFKVNKWHVNMSFPISNFEGNFSTYVFGKSFWHYRNLKSECWTSRHILWKKILNSFICEELIILCKRVKYVCSSHFPEAITTNMQIGNVSFVFK